ncbi:DNA recombination protein RmuC [Frigidibacter sp.]|uniref:DNA recombination protein RmuC n=1 Tax=Frigidibacter sp. TaxID=2586418 RepID=UPI00273378A2|nr:DNA recombination protein RmuC [Frigidibacter sp.]MDP3341764.1 DNA recombination protein RmuC [Frigidibacter sp.]
MTPLIEFAARLDAAGPPWLPWAALALLALLVLALMIWRRSGALALAEARAARAQEAEAERGHALHQMELELARVSALLTGSVDEAARLQTALSDTDARALEAQRVRYETAQALSQRSAELEAAAARAARAETALLEAKGHIEKLRETMDLRVLDMQKRAATAERDLAALRAQSDQQRLSGEEKIALLSAVREDMQHKFKELADLSLKTTGEELTRASRERLEAALNPLKEHVAHFQVELKAVHEGALRDRQALKTEIEMLSRRSEEVSKEAVALTRALKGDKQRQGAWGEMILESLLERSGLRKGEEYTTQDSHAGDEGGRLRSDVIVRMPNGSALVIDSKVSLVDYETCVNSEDEVQATAARRRHVTALKSHVDTISKKDYARLVGHSVDYTVMFVPIEGALSEALREAGDLTGYALDKSVMIATPTTLMMALRTIASTWTIERRNRNAEDIANRAGLLYEKVAGFIDAMESVGANLGKAQNAYGTAMDRLVRGNGNVLAQVDKLKRLGARTSKTIQTDFDAEPDETGDIPELGADPGDDPARLPPANADAAE